MSKILMIDDDKDFGSLVFTHFSALGYGMTLAENGKAGLAAAQGALPLEVNSTRVIDAILRLAENSRVKAIPLTTKPWAKDTVVTGYYAFRLSMSASGEFPQVSSFIGQLESGEFASVVVESLAVSRVFTTSEGAAPVVAGLTLAIYARSTPAE